MNRKHSNGNVYMSDTAFDRDFFVYGSCSMFVVRHPAKNEILSQVSYQRVVKIVYHTARRRMASPKITAPEIVLQV